MNRPANDLFRHCDFGEEDEAPGFEEREDDDEQSCLFPGECLMPGWHLRGECHIAEMYEAYAQEVAAENHQGANVV